MQRYKHAVVDGPGLHQPYSILRFGLSQLGVRNAETVAGEFTMASFAGGLPQCNFSLFADQLTGFDFK